MISLAVLLSFKWIKGPKYQGNTNALCECLIYIYRQTNVLYEFKEVEFEHKGMLLIPFEWHG